MFGDVVSTYKFLLEVVRVNESILGAEEDVLDELLVTEGCDIVVGVDSVVTHHGRVDTTRIHPLGLRMLPTTT